MEKYRIKDVARLLGLSPETLRYYESRNLVSPGKNKDTGYRYYGVEEVNCLLDCLTYRSYDFSLDEIEKMLLEDELSDLVERYRAKELAYMHQINTLRRKAQHISQLKRKLQSIEKCRGQFSVTASLPLVFQSNRFNGEYKEGLSSAHTNRTWIKLMPYIEPTFICSKSTPADNAPFDELKYGWSLSPDEAIALQLDLSPPVEYIPEGKTLYTVFSAVNEEKLLALLSQRIIPAALGQGYRLVGDPYGHLLCRCHRNGRLLRYYELWLPIA